MADRQRHTVRNVALVGGAAALAWLLLRGKGWGLGAGTGLGLGAFGDATPSAPTVPCRVWIRAHRIELEGAPADLATVVTRCRERGHAEVRATGDAIVRAIADVLHALQAAGVVIYAPPDLLNLLPAVPERPR